MGSGEWVVVDGSMGEGGGQILRTAVALAAVLGRPLRIVNIRAKRRPPGLRPQHLTAVRAVAAISGGKLRGAEVGSTSLEFMPGRVRGGRYRFDVGTAGSVALIIQALAPVLAYSDSPVEVELTGGTDVPMAPTIDYMREVFARIVAMLGYEIEIRVLRRGHYPRGGGRVVVRVPDPPGGFRARSFVERGPLKGVYVRSHAVRLPGSIAERQARSAASLVRERLGVEPIVRIEAYKPHSDPHLGPGTGVLVWAVFGETVMGGDSIGKKGKPAEVVGREAAESLLEDMATGAALDRHMSDMAPVYLALAGGVSTVFGARLTGHASTILELLSIMVDGFEYRILEGGLERPFKAELRGAGVSPR
ncbi:RNA 3'-terminal phosphate cyclase [Aeropyrum pernix]|uniref:RNA 3'-terminal phosphate cyclase n=1 Tax=Aeropyrum pernix TaxID=56636 RepID=A0A401H8T4_AERPX|nr:RNA 3'-terminal phosphate cyclase [Aeropyrum pernix]GBF08749.1 RNA 3'-terminal phosphate cyclase [Aeropyrum pernix]